MAALATVNHPQFRAETRSEASVLVVTESTERKVWLGPDAIGKTLRGWEKKRYQAVGVVRDSLGLALGTDR